MTSPSHISAPVCVPYQHNVRAAGRVAPVKLALNAPLNPYAQAKPKSHTRQGSGGEGRYSANSAAPGFAAQILVEAGLAGSDPFANARGAKAYGARLSPSTNLRLVA